MHHLPSGDEGEGEGEGEGAGSDEGEGAGSGEGEGAGSGEGEGAGSGQGEGEGVRVEGCAALSLATSSDPAARRQRPHGLKASAFSRPSRPAASLRSAAPVEASCSVTTVPEAAASSGGACA